MSRRYVLIAISAVILGLIFSYAYTYSRSAADIYRSAVSVPLDSNPVLYTSVEGYDIRSAILVAKVDSAFKRRFDSPTFFRDCDNGATCAGAPMPAESLPVMEGVSADLIKDRKVAQRVAAWLNKTSSCQHRSFRAPNDWRYGWTIDTRAGWTVVCLSPDSTVAVFREEWN